MRAGGPWADGHGFVNFVAVSFAQCSALVRDAGAGAAETVTGAGMNVRSERERVRMGDGRMRGGTDLDCGLCFMCCDRE